MRFPAFLRQPARPPIGYMAGAFIAGAGVALGQAPFDLWYVAIVALCLLFRLAWRRAPGWAGFCAGIGYVCVGMFWITEPFLVEPEIYGWMAPFALLFMGMGMGAFWALGMGVGARLGRTPTRRMIGIAVGLAAVDALRSYVFTGFPWILVGHIWIDTPIAQLAAYIGAIGLGILTVLIAALPWVFGVRTGTIVGVLAIVIGWGAGTLRLNTEIPARADPINLRLVQPNATQALKWDTEYASTFFYRHLDLTAQEPSAGSPRPDLVIWPETAVPFWLNNAGDGLSMIADSAHGAPVALGIQRAEGTRYFNSLIVLDPDAAVEDIYDKVHLVPFGEYIPWGDALASIGIRAFAAREGNGYTAGRAETVLDLGRLGHVQPLICYEAVFPQDIRNVPSRPDWIMQVTNDAWFGNISGPWQHLALSRLRAIEFGLPIARAANTGISAMIDAHGRIVDELGMNVQGVIDAPLPPSLPITPYARTGDWPAMAVILVLLGLVAIRPKKYSVDPPAR